MIIRCKALQLYLLDWVVSNRVFSNLLTTCLNSVDSKLL